VAHRRTASTRQSTCLTLLSSRGICLTFVLSDALKEADCLGSNLFRFSSMSLRSVSRFESPEHRSVDLIDYLNN
jgi:hypothetical protein